MQRNATACIERVLVLEGGYVNNPADNGGPTNKGITLATFRKYIKPSATIDDLKALTRVQAIDVYRQRYWNRVRADELPDGIDFAVFDFCVHSGAYRAITYLQQTLQAYGVYDGGIDGKIGPKTLHGCETVDARKAVVALCARRMSYLRSLDDWSTFEDGWTNRVDDVRTYAITLTQHPNTTPTATKQGLGWSLCSLFHRR